jgi:hypothetical protein
MQNYYKSFFRKILQLVYYLNLKAILNQTKIHKQFENKSKI